MQATTKTKISRIEAIDMINSVLSKNNLVCSDLFGKKISISSKEEYDETFVLARNMYKENIYEFYKEACYMIDKFEGVIKKVRGLKGSDMYAIHNIIWNEFNLNNIRNSTIKMIFIKSYTSETEKTIDTIRQVYKELGYDNLLKYINLIMRPNRFYEMLNRADDQVVAMHYLLYKTDHHSPTYYKRNLSGKTLYREVERNILNTIDEITSSRHEYINFMNNEKQQYVDWFDRSDIQYANFMVDSNSKFDEFMTDIDEKFKHIEEVYSERLKIEEPSKFMNAKSDEYAKKASYWTIATIVLGVFLVLMLAIIISPDIEINDTVISIKLFSNEFPVYSSIIVLAIVCLIIYLLRIFVKMIISSKHLSEEYQQKHILTYFYLSLVDTNAIDDGSRNIILANLFSKADTGLIKGDGGNDIESLIQMLTSSSK